VVSCGWVKLVPMFDALRSDPRFETIAAAFKVRL